MAGNWMAIRVISLFRLMLWQPQVNLQQLKDDIRFSYDRVTAFAGLKTVDSGV